ncbi:MAG: electron transfer flavoprotein subunit alpha [Candidatus Schekmanbacteria bacterium RIFCSPHIGHO2_02_FULL_38_11]|uniref:Electron transfer flavoprotein subunit alpha n=1 Tax=Candidatus Schekmanbacteria bacterium RIFCSPLOWO2_12_FULL_38_15 TaxID=1817883 RepID=A0A1F7SC60_9BACT|nr:MAG: electron transfer flavoprotein subunit alpha [Candidatus Schekmanbacteria bacterium GWA2_38_9]OGL48262.1 MAG: electron transfer flavoprotein subunit alpha [Candidatus Schekmanbacteria bacterium RIFCSPLOWO2_02_FULL_38_14]OGL51301.1 MAG: electron transfer flavoprotein subunit alpha [Candidatus Schekmanbacteria bacterium RIFCSPLOWO2_12_FULL_38_15]OGL55610.1 MAG: electron transfer flavoprotein subunit alpha [Candidatus Schekmanbacteria bacterium RIFCSPHIGHO2_02_FULL_38_11]
MGKAILAFAEQRDGKLKKNAYEVISTGKKLADEIKSELVSLLIGSGIEGLASELGSYGSDKVLVADSEILKLYSSEGYSSVLVDAVKKCDAGIVLLPASSMGKDLAPAAAAKLETGVAMDCIGVAFKDGKLEATRPVYAGKIMTKVGCSKEPFFITLRPNVFSVSAPSPDKKASVEKINVGFSAESIRAKVKEIVAAAGGKMDLTEASVIVAGGRGMKSGENFKVLEELADALGGVVGASRSVVDAGWRPHSDQVGQTGKVVSPNLYIACGVSGAIQHLAGMSSSKCIVAINKDSDAPIFQMADYGIVGDLFQVVPVLAQEVKKVLGK